MGKLRFRLEGWIPLESFGFKLQVFVVDKDKFSTWPKKKFKDDASCFLEHENLWHSECKCSHFHQFEVPLPSSSHYLYPGSRKQTESQFWNREFNMKLPRPVLPSPPCFLWSTFEVPSLLFSAFVDPSEGHSGRWHFGTEKHLGCTYKYLFVGQHVIEFSSIMAGVFVAKYWKLVSETPLRRGRATSWFGSIGMFWRCWTVLRLNSIMAAKEFSFFLLIGLDGHVEVSFVFSFWIVYWKQYFIFQIPARGPKLSTKKLLCPSHHRLKANLDGETNLKIKSCAGFSPA